MEIKLFRGRGGASGGVLNIDRSHDRRQFGYWARDCTFLHVLQQTRGLSVATERTILAHQYERRTRRRGTQLNPMYSLNRMRA